MRAPKTGSNAAETKEFNDGEHKLFRPRDGEAIKRVKASSVLSYEVL